MGGSNTKGFRFPYTVFEESDAKKAQKMPWDQKARVERITVEGLRRTKNDIIENIMQDIFTANTFGGIVEKCAFVSEKLHRLDCFMNIKVFIDISRSNPSSKYGYEVTYKVEELGYIRAQTNLALGDNEGSFVVKGKALNLKGHGEKLETKYSYSTSRTSNVNVAFVKPLMGQMFSVCTASLFRQSSEVPASGYKLTESGILLDLEVQPKAKMVHNIQYEGVMRDLSCISKNAPYQIRENSGPTLKSSIKHILSFDLRDKPVFPRNGLLIGTATELAGLGGNIGFMKNESFLQMNLPLTQRSTFQFTFQAGFVNHVDDNKTVSICDKLFLGGPMSVRGFSFRGIGPHADGCSLGIESYWASGFHFYSHLPFTLEKNKVNKICRTHAFVNFGNCGPFNLSSNIPQNVEELVKNFRASYGFGLCLYIGSSRIELSCSLPVYFYRGDTLSRGLELSLGGNFL